MKRKFAWSKKLTAVAVSLVLAASPAMAAAPVYAGVTTGDAAEESKAEQKEEKKTADDHESDPEVKDQEDKADKKDQSENKKDDSSESGSGSESGAEKKDEASDSGSKKDSSENGSEDNEKKTDEAADKEQKSDDEKKADEEDTVNEDKTEAEDEEKKTEEVKTQEAEQTNQAAVQETTISGECELTSDAVIDSDTVASITIPSGADVTLTIADGATLTNVKDKHTITVKKGGTLTIECEGTVDNISNARADIINDGGTVSINGITLIRSDEAKNTTTSGGGNSYYNIVNYGEMTIENAIVNSSGHFSSLIENGYYNYNKKSTDGMANPKLTIISGTFNGGINTIKNDDGGYLYINGGEFENMTQHAVMNWNVAEISGGSFKNNTKDATIYNGYGDANVDKGELIITDGIIDGFIYTTAKSELSVEGGAIAGGIKIAGKPESLNINAEQEKDDYTFIGWFDSNTGDKYEDEKLPDSAFYKPVFTSNKTTKKTDADIPSESKAAETVNNAVSEIIGNGGKSSSSVEIKTDDPDIKSKITDALSNSKDINTEIVLSSLQESVLSDADREAIKSAAGNNSIADLTDISINLLIGTDKVAQITKLAEEITITMDIPAELRSSGRSFAVIRLHDGKAEILPAKTIEGGTKVQFSTDKFSTYALIYSNKTSGGSGSGSSDRSKSVSNNGTWVQDSIGWWFKKTDGSYPKDMWFECAWNGSSNWYHFNAQGYADGGWFTDKDGQRYFLHDQHDGKFGYMYTGWNLISGQWYYFNTATKAASTAAAGSSRGSLVVNCTTPDGYRVDVNGAWIK